MRALAKKISGRVVELHPRRTVQEGKGKAGTAFLIEPEADDDAFLQWVLGSAGVNVSSFADGNQFLAALQDDDRGCVLMNIRACGADCAAVLEVLAVRRIPLPAVLYSGAGGAVSVVQPLPAGKPDSRGESFGLAVAERVMRAMEHAEWMSATRRESEQGKERLACLTKREMEIAQLVIAGKPNKVIAFELKISDRTVEIHRSRIMQKTKCDSLPGLVWLFASAGLTNAEAWPVAQLMRHVSSPTVPDLGEH